MAVVLAVTALVVTTNIERSGARGDRADVARRQGDRVRFRRRADSGRERPAGGARAAGVAVGAAVAAKLFVRPLVVWLLLTRRLAAAAWASVSAVALALGAWAADRLRGACRLPGAAGASRCFLRRV